MNELDPVAGRMTGEPRGILAAVNDPDAVVLDWRQVFEESLAAWLAEQLPAMERVKITPLDEVPRMDVPAWGPDSDLIDWPAILAHYGDAPAGW